MLVPWPDFPSAVCQYKEKRFQNMTCIPCEEVSSSEAAADMFSISSPEEHEMVTILIICQREIHQTFSGKHQGDLPSEACSSSVTGYLV